jgi:phage terminase large subunit-like protein
MLFDVNSNRRDRTILIDWTTSFLPLTEIGDIEVKSSEQMQCIQTYDQTNEQRNVGGKKSQMNEV